MVSSSDSCLWNGLVRQLGGRSVRAPTRQRDARRTLAPEERADTYAYDVRLSYSQDEGKTWSPSFSPHDDGTKTEHGFASLFQIPGVGLGLVWLDGRAMKPEPGHGDHGAAGGAMSVRFATFDSNWKRTADAPVDLRVCECCPTTAAVTSDGPIAAFRNRTDDEVRDIYISRLENGRWTEPKPVHQDGWKINACPVNGPMLSARGRDVVIAWFTAKNNEGRAFAAFSHDAGRTFGAPVRLDDVGALGRVDVELLPNGSAIASWIEFTDQSAQFRIRRVDPSGARSDSTTISSLVGSRSSGDPRIASRGDEIVFAWTENADGRSRCARLRRVGEPTARADRRIDLPVQNSPLAGNSFGSTGIALAVLVHLGILAAVGPLVAWRRRLTKSP